MPKLIYDVVLQLDKKKATSVKESIDRTFSGKTSKNVERAKNEVQELDTSLKKTSVSAERAEQALHGISKGTTSLSTGVRRSRQEVQNLSKATNNSNQILFSFGDAVQDSAQFTQGFSAGARAIGNNLTFAAEQIALANQKTGSIGQTFKMLGASMLGPAGIVFGVNALVTAITVLPQLFEDSGAAAEAASNKYEKYRQAIKEIRDITQQDFGIRARIEEELRITNLAISAAEARADLIERANEIETDRLRFAEKNTEAMRQQEDALRAEAEARGRLISLYGFETTELSELQEQLEVTEKTLGLFTETSNSARIAIGTFVDQITGDARLALDKFNAGVDTNRDNINANAETIRTLVSTYQGAARAGRTEFIPVIIRLKDLLDELTESTDKSTESIDDFREAMFRLRSMRRAQRDLFTSNIGDAGLVTDKSTAEEERRERLKKHAEQLGISEQLAAQRLGSAKSVADAEVKITKDKTDAQLALERQKERARVQLYSQAASAIGNILGAAFGQSKGVRIAQTLLDTFASAQGAYASQLIPGDPSSFVRAKIAAGLAIASGLARIAQMRQITPDSNSGGGSGGASSSAAGTGAFIGRTGERRHTPPIRPDIIDRRDRGTEFKIIVNADKKGFSAWVEDGKRARKSESFTLRSDV